MVEQLYTEIGHILGMDRLSDTVLLGAGNMGRAIANHMDFENRGIRLVGIFDDSPELIGKTVRGMEVQPIKNLDSVCRIKNPRWPSSASRRRRPPSWWNASSRWGYGDFGTSAITTSAIITPGPWWRMSIWGTA